MSTILALPWIFGAQAYITTLQLVVLPIGLMIIVLEGLRCLRIE